MKIAIVGMGYVGLSNAVLLSNKFDVIGYDIDIKKIDSFKKSPENYNFRVTHSQFKALFDAEWVFVCVPTDSKNGRLDCSIVESVISNCAEICPDAKIVIRSTVSIGFTQRMNNKYHMDVVFCPEFLREGTAIVDSFFPDRIVIGHTEKNYHTAERLCNILIDCIMSANIPVYFCTCEEAEASKLLVNTMLAARVALFNEIDTFCRIKGLNSKNVIDNICSDPRIGNHYNNPSFGYGGYCLPKDSMEIFFLIIDKTSYVHGVHILPSIPVSNNCRKTFVVDEIVDKTKKQSTGIIGFYKLAMKSGSDNSRESAIIDVIKMIAEYSKKIKMLIYDENQKGNIAGVEIVNNLDYFFDRVDFVVANRVDDDLKLFNGEIFTADIYHTN